MVFHLCFINILWVNPYKFILEKIKWYWEVLDVVVVLQTCWLNDFHLGDLLFWFLFAVVQLGGVVTFQCRYL